MKKLLVTGGCGFLGSQVCEFFKKRGWSVWAYDNMSKFETSRIQFGNQDLIREYNYDYLRSINVPVMVGDICDVNDLAVAAKDSNYIINCAAQPAMTLSAENPVLDFETNARGTLNLLEEARKQQIPFATCSTIHVYGTGINDTLRETDDFYIRQNGYRREIVEDDEVLTGQLTPLHASKFTSELYVRTYGDTYGAHAVAFRLTGIYGPHQFGSEDHGWVSLLAIKTMMGLPIQLIGTGRQVRDILYINDAVEAFWKWYNSPQPSGVFNICGGMANFTSVLQCLDMLRDIYGVKQTITSGGSREGDLLYFVGSYAKAHNAFGWFPTTRPEDGLEELVKWLKQNKTLFHV